MKLEVQKLAVSRAEKISDKLHLFLHSNTNNESYYDVDFDNSSRILTASLRIAHKRNIVLEVNTYYPYGMLNTSLSWHLTNNQYKYQGKEYLNTLNYNVLDFGARLYDPAIARFTTPDPIMQFNNGYFAMGGNPVSMTDPSGMKSTTGHYDDVQEHGLSETPERGGGGSPVTIDGMPLYGSTPMLEHIMGELMAKGPDGEDNILGYSSSTLSVNIIQKDDKIFTSFNPVYQMVNTINNNYKSKYAHYNIQGKDDRESGETDDYFKGYSYGLAISWDDLNILSQSVQLDKSTLHKNIKGTSYVGGRNPMSYNRKYNYSYWPTNLAEYPAIGHDRRYDNLGAKGITGLVLDPRTTGADIRFVAEELAIAFCQGADNNSRLDAAIFGIGLGSLSLGKSFLTLSNPVTAVLALYWYQQSNKGVNNIPSN